MKKTERESKSHIDVALSDVVFKIRKATAKYECSNDVEVAVGTESGELRVEVRTLGPASPGRINKA